MDNLTIFVTFVHEKRVFSHNVIYLKHVITHVTQVSLITFAFIFLFDGVISCIKIMCESHFRYVTRNERILLQLLL